MPTFVTSDAVLQWIGLESRSIGASLPALTAIVAATNQYLLRYPWLVDEDGEPTDMAKIGGVMLAARLYKRRGSPTGTDTTVGGETIYISRVDPDIARWLEIDGYSRIAIA